MLSFLLNLVAARNDFTIPVIGIAGLLALFIVGAIIIWIAGVFFFLPAFIVSGIVYWISGSDTLAGVAFLLVALSSLTRRKRRTYAHTTSPPAKTF